MIKAVFFDLYHTLIRYDPPREESLADILRRAGVARNARELRKPLVVGDEYFYAASSHQGFNQRSEAEKKEVLLSYYELVFKEAGINPRPELIKDVLSGMQNIKYEMVLFDDVLPAFNALKSGGKMLGLISNIDKDITPLLDKLGITGWLNICMTSYEAGVSKPHPEIFHKAVQKAGMDSGDVLYVGDQYQIDVLGARSAGLRALLVDRGGFFDEVPAEEKVQNLMEIGAYLS